MPFARIFYTLAIEAGFPAVGAAAEPNHIESEYS
jgi:hypothetical protein